MTHVSRTELRRGKLSKDDIKKLLKEDEKKPRQLGLFKEQVAQNIPSTSRD
jgi:hypothetical protein